MSKLPTAEETLNQHLSGVYNPFGHPNLESSFIAAIESHTAAHTAGLLEENTRYRQAMESIATRWNKVAEHNEMRTALHLIQQDVFEAIKNN